MSSSLNPLAIIGKGVLNDVPLVDIQPPLADGIHLRWAFRRDLGFPWFGFHLFRRPSLDSSNFCLGRYFTLFRDRREELRLALGLGTISSNVPLVASDNFPPVGVWECDLGPFFDKPRHFVQFELTPPDWAVHASVTVGFRAAVVRSVVLDLRSRLAEALAGSFEEAGFRFRHRATDPDRPFELAVRNVDGQTASGLVIDEDTIIELTNPSQSVVIDLSVFRQGAGFAFALNQDGEVLDTKEVGMPSGQSIPVSLSADADRIVSIAFRATTGRFLLHRIVRVFDAGLPAVLVQAFRQGQKVAETMVSGAYGSIVTAEIQATSFDKIVIVPANGESDLPPASLVDLCVSLYSRNLTEGWELVPDCPSPLTLPLTHPDYPATGEQAENPAGDELTALDRILYGPVAPFAGMPFENLRSRLVRLVDGGPAFAPMADSSRVEIHAQAPPLADDQLSLPDIHPLDLVLLAALHPAVAQMVSLYWVDRTAQAGQFYDYLILADYTNASKLSAPKALGMFKDGIPGVEGYVLPFQTLVNSAPLASPTDVQAFLLPGETPASTTNPTPPFGLIGLTWTAETGVSTTLPTKAVSYHVWRRDEGDLGQPSGAGPETWLTKLGPILAQRNRPDPLTVSQWPEGWPNKRFYRIDAIFQEAWYGYTVSGMDIFGSISAPSQPASWMQWYPTPDPVPWWFVPPAGEKVLHPGAVHVLDKTPPPPPAMVEAALLDPKDPYVLLADDAYVSWRNAFPDLVGLRVRWRWGQSQKTQAPDTAEFRIYYNPASPANEPIPPRVDDWQTRCHVTAIGDPHATNDGVLYDVFLPLTAPGSVFAGGVPLFPNLANPMVYADVTVTAVDGAPHTPDSPKWAGTPFGDRQGNESHPATPAKIVRVLRDQPGPPMSPGDDGENLYATPADYYSRSYWKVALFPRAYLGSHVFRSLDATVYEYDRRQRPRAIISTATSGIFPDPSVETRWTEAKRQQVADALNALNLFAPTPEGQAALLAEYPKLSNDAVRILAGLPGNEGAFLKVTHTPLPETQTEYVDTLDGRTLSRYFYRTAYVDKATNQSELSLSSPPIYLPKVTPPKTPTITRSEGGERQISIYWAWNREPSVVEYRVYRAETRELAEELRQMALVATLSAPLGPAADRPGEAAPWVDVDVPGNRDFFYVVVSVDDAGNVSAPSKVVRARAYDESLPVPPPLAVTWVQRGGEYHAEVSWTSADAVVVQRRDAGKPVWQNLTTPRDPGSVTVRDPYSEPSHSYEYRFKTIKSTGVIAFGAPGSVSLFFNSFLYIVDLRFSKRIAWLLPPSRAGWMFGCG